MTLLAFAIRDEKVGAFLQPFFAPAIGSAIRSFLDACTGDTPMAKHPGDYTLYRIGSYDDNTAQLLSDTPLLVASGSEAVA